MRIIIALILVLFLACQIMPSYAALNLKNKTEMTDVQKEANKEAMKLREEAFAFYTINDIENAYKKLESISDEFKQDGDYLIMANILQDKAKNDDAIGMLNESIKINPKFYKAYYNMGIIFIEQENFESAKEYFKKSIKYNKDFAYGYYNLGLCAYKENDYKSAKSYFNRAILRKNDVPEFYYNLSLVYKKLNNVKNAQKSLDVYNELIKR